MINEIKNRIYEAEGLLELLHLRKDKVGDLLPMIEAKLREALADVEKMQGSQNTETKERISTATPDTDPEYALDEETYPDEETYSDEETYPDEETTLDEEPELDDDTADDKSAADEFASGEEEMKYEIPAALQDEPKKMPGFCLNDRYRFRRAIFGGSSAEFNFAMSHIASLDGYRQAEDYFYGDMGLDPEDPDVIDFMTIIKNYFEV